MAISPYLSTERIAAATITLAVRGHPHPRLSRALGSGAFRPRSSRRDGDGFAPRPVGCRLPALAGQLVGPIAAVAFLSTFPHPQTELWLPFWKYGRSRSRGGQFSGAGARAARDPSRWWGSYHGRIWRPSCLRGRREAEATGFCSLGAGSMLSDNPDFPVQVGNHFKHLVVIAAHRYGASSASAPLGLYLLLLLLPLGRLVQLGSGLVGADSGRPNFGLLIRQKRGKRGTE